MRPYLGVGTLISARFESPPRVGLLKMSGTCLIRDYRRHVVLSPLVRRENRKKTPGIEHKKADSRRRRGELKVQVGVEKGGGQAEEAVAACQRGYSSVMRLLRCRDCNRVFLVAVNSAAIRLPHLKGKCYLLYMCHFSVRAPERWSLYGLIRFSVCLCMFSFEMGKNPSF